jgi:ribosomal protein S5
MIIGDKIGLYGKGASDVDKARADAKKAAEHAEKNFSKTKTFKCTIQPQPK